MANVRRIFGVKLRDTNTGLFKKEGSSLTPRGWSKIGKVWSSEGHLKSHLTMVMMYYKDDSFIDTWEVVEMFNDGTENVYPARELYERPAKK